MAQFGTEIWAIIRTMAPYLLLGFVLAGFLSVVVTPRWIRRHLGGGRWGGVVKASLLGVPLPLCSCGVIPVGASLRKQGASRGATASFMISTPQTGVDSILLTWFVLGPLFAVYRAFAAFVSGLFGGILVSLFGERDAISAGHGEPQHNDEPADADPAPPRRRLIRALHFAFVELPADMGPALLLGLLVAGGLTALLPPESFAKTFGTGFGAMLVMLVLGVPVYVCATASVPVAAALIVQQGVTPGAAFVFLVTGPVTNAATFITLWRLLGRRSTFIYAFSVMASALAAGVLLDTLISPEAVRPVWREMHEHGGVSWLLDVSGIVLLALLAPSLWTRIRGWARRHRFSRPAENESTVELAVTGMTCGRCAEKIARGLESLEGVRSCQADADAGRIRVTGVALHVDDLAQYIQQQGYKAQALAPESA